MSEFTIAVQEPHPSAQSIDAFVVPTDTGAAVLIDTDYASLDARRGPFQIAVYGRAPMSPGELALTCARVEADLFTFARRMARHGRRWPLELLVGLLELGAAGLLLAFLFLNRQPIHAIVVWAVPLAFAPAALHTLRALRLRRTGARARAALLHGEVLPWTVVGRDGDGLARLRDLWRAADRGGETRDLLRLEREARLRMRWPAAAQLYRRLAGAPPARPRGRLARLRAMLRPWPPAERRALTYLLTDAP